MASTKIHQLAKKFPNKSYRELELKLQASSAKRRKIQAASCKPQAARFKRQAASGKLLDI
jgi:hypothetical protein